MTYLVKIMNSTVETEIRQREGNRSNCLSYHMYDIYVGIIGSFNVIDYAFCSLFMILLTVHDSGYSKITIEIFKFQRIWLASIHYTFMQVIILLNLKFKKKKIPVYIYTPLSHFTNCTLQNVRRYLKNIHINIYECQM